MDGAIAGKTIVVTGTLQQLTRDRVKALIEEMGGRASSSVNETDFLLAGVKGSKLAKAKVWGRSYQRMISEVSNLFSS